jgi:hypothetical protein
MVAGLEVTVRCRSSVVRERGRRGWLLQAARGLSGKRRREKKKEKREKEKEKREKGNKKKENKRIK